MVTPIQIHCRKPLQTEHQEQGIQSPQVDPNVFGHREGNCENNQNKLKTTLDKYYINSGNCTMQNLNLH